MLLYAGDSQYVCRTAECSSNCSHSFFFSFIFRDTNHCGAAHSLFSVRAHSGVDAIRQITDNWRRWIYAGYLYLILTHFLFHLANEIVFLSHFCFHRCFVPKPASAHHAHQQELRMWKLAVVRNTERMRIFCAEIRKNKNMNSLCCNVVLFFFFFSKNLETRFIAQGIESWNLFESWECTRCILLLHERARMQHNYVRVLLIASDMK